MDDPEVEVLRDPIEPLLERRSDRRGWTLPYPDPMSSERIHESPWTILPSTVANIPCNRMTTTTLLSWLNPIFKTRFRLTPEVDACLTELIADGCDLGQVYGYLRPWWPDVQNETEFGSS